MCAFPFIFGSCIILLAYVSFTVIYSHLHCVYGSVTLLHLVLNRRSEVDSGLRYKKKEIQFLPFHAVESVCFYVGTYSRQSVLIVFHIIFLTKDFKPDVITCTVCFYCVKI